MWLLDINQIDVFVSGIENTKNGDILSDVLSRIFTKPRRQCAGRVLHDFPLNLDRDKVGPILGPAKRPALGNRPICHSKRSAPQVFGGPKRRATSNPGKCRGRGPPSPLHDGFCSGKGGVGWGVPLAGWGTYSQRFRDNHGATPAPSFRSTNRRYLARVRQVHSGSP